MALCICFVRVNESLYVSKTQCIKELKSRCKDKASFGVNFCGIIVFQFVESLKHGAKLGKLVCRTENLVASF